MKNLLANFFEFTIHSHDENEKKICSIIVWLYYEFYKFLQFLECEWKNFEWSNFLSLNVNVNSVVRSHRDGQISPFITQGTLYFPHSWLSSHGKNKFPHSLLRSSWGNLLSPFLLSHSWGKYDVPFVIHGKIFFSPFVASPLKGKNPIPIPPNYGIKPFTIDCWRLLECCTKQREIGGFQKGAVCPS